MTVDRRGAVTPTGLLQIEGARDLAFSRDGSIVLVAAEAAGHPILEAVESAEIPVRSWLYKTSPLEKLRRDLHQTIMDAAGKAIDGLQTDVGIEDSGTSEEENDDKPKYKLGFVGRTINWFMLRFDTRYIDATALVVFDL